MKYLITFTLVLSMLSSNAQVSGNKITISENAIVKDSAGAIIPYPTWQKLLESGDYTVKIKNFGSASAEFQLFRLTATEKIAREGRIGKPRESAFFTTGKTIGDAKLVTLSGKIYQLSELKNKVVVLNFWFINCQPCRMEIPELNRLTAQYKDSSNVIFLAVALDEAKDLKEFLKELPFSYEIVDKGIDVTSQYGITSYPTHVVIGKNGNVLFHTSGYTSTTIPWLRKSIDAALIQ